MIIAKEAIETFLNQEVAGWDFLKKESVKDLWETLTSDFPDFRYTYKPFKHQIAMMLLGINNPAFLFFADMGGGKTKVLIDLFQYHKKEGNVHNCLVVCPSSVITTWEEELELHGPDFTYTSLIGSSEERHDLLEDGTDFFFINYQGLQVMMADFKEVTSKAKGTRKKRMENVKKINNFAGKFDMIIYDEIHFCKSSDSLIFNLSEHLSKRIEFRYGLTGTPFGRDLADFWAQYYLIDLGETLGSSKSFFLNAYFKAKSNFWGGVDWNFKKELTFNFRKRIKNLSIRYHESEMNDVPPRTDIKIPIKLTPELEDYYKQAYTEFLKVQDNKIKSGNAFIKARMICSGFIEFTNDDGERQVIEFKNNPKLEALIDFVKSTPSDTKIIVGKEYIRSGIIISNRLKKEKIKHVVLDSTTKNRSVVIKSFQHDPDCKIIIMNCLSGGFGLNLQMARYLLFYESPTSPITRKQTEKRMHRTGQKHHTFVYDFYIKGKVEEKILGFIAEGKDLFTHIMEWKEI